MSNFYFTLLSLRGARRRGGFSQDFQFRVTFSRQGGHVRGQRAAHRDDAGGGVGKPHRRAVQRLPGDVPGAAAVKVVPRQRAAQMGANAIVGIDLDYETIGENGSMLMVTCSGTAVVI